MLFGLFKKKPTEPAQPEWPFKDPAMSEAHVRAAAQMGVRRLKLDAHPDKTEYPPAIDNAVKTIEQSAAVKAIWKDEVYKAVDQRREGRHKIAPK